MSPIRTKLMHDDNIHNIDSLLPNLISDIPNNSITSCDITPTVNYATLQYNTSLSQYVNNYYETANSSLSYSSTTQATVLPQPLIVRLEPISTNFLTNNCVQPISILYSTNSKEQINLNPVNPFTSTCYPSTSNTNRSSNDDKFIDVTNEKFEDLHVVYDQAVRKLSYFNDENVSNKYNDYEWSSLTKSKLPEFQQLCIYSQPVSTLDC